jgi:hypothetical protein
MKDVIKYWQEIFDIKDWNISTKRILPEQIVYNGEDYFIGISRDFDKKEAIINHDIDLTEESIVHELLHIVYPEKNEAWINETTGQFIFLNINTNP